MQRRIHQLGLAGEKAYRRYLAEHPGEWRALDAVARVTVSRFYRDKRMFAFLADEVFSAWRC
jgi:chemotaxis protein methyltransferase CheR